MTARVLVIGLDAAEATLIERWAAAGALPGFAALIERGSHCRLANSLETLPGAIWPEIESGRSCGKLPLYYHPVQLHTGEARLRPILAEEVDPEDYYWAAASRAGRRVAAIDMPQSVRCPGLNGVQLMEWGLHDRNFAIASEPPSLLEELRARHGDHPIRVCDDHGETRAGYEALREAVMTGIERKTALLLELLRREPWDLFTCCYGETHCVGHQFWHFHDPRHPRHDAAAPADFRDAIRDAYARVDAGIRALVDAAGPDATVLVVASHGMGLYVGGYHLVGEVLARLGLSSAPETPLRRMLRGLHRAGRRLPRGLKPHLRRLLDYGEVRFAQAAVGALLDPLESPNTRAAPLYNNRCGAIRINLRGREPFGQVAPGNEARTLVEEIREALLALEHPDSGEKIVARVVTAEEAFGPEHHPDVPDLMVLFRDDLGVIEACRSKRIGTVRIPLYTNRMPRTGDHTVESRLWIAGPGVAAGRRLPEGNVLDIAPTVLGLLGVPVPAAVDGRTLPGLAHAEPGAADGRALAVGS
jgi:predicted AlkP superfamily phosphohydrolase/phosphomutase